MDHVFHVLRCRHCGAVWSVIIMSRERFAYWRGYPLGQAQGAIAGSRPFCVACAGDVEVAVNVAVMTANGQVLELKETVLAGEMN